MNRMRVDRLVRIARDKSSYGKQSSDLLPRKRWCCKVTQEENSVNVRVHQSLVITLPHSPILESRLTGYNSLKGYLVEDGVRQLGRNTHILLIAAKFS